jgi:hypothetical protein
VRIKHAGLIACYGILFTALPVLAHHSFKAEFDETRPVTFYGIVTKLSWKNPHVMLNMDVKDESGRVANWEMELASPNGLLREGWKVDSLKPGDHVVVSGYAARDGSHIASGRKVVLGGKANSAIAQPGK